jgi:hypothetical protein
MYAAGGKRNAWGCNVPLKRRSYADIWVRYAPAREHDGPCAGNDDTLLLADVI